jgi:molybdenum cofactor synthesis domain-containing protein
MRAAILAVGTELTTGQIQNRNAAWLSGKLEELGIPVALHETVPDDRALIRSALERCQGAAGLLLVTGGLGPTTDDFTREVIAEWAGAKLEPSESSWARVDARLRSFGIPVAESNRQQCVFPRGSTILTNEQGTADAFTLETRGARLWALPGPPREVEWLWENGVAAGVRAAAPDARPERLHRWQCLGRSEAELGELTEKILEGSGLRTGYRAHRPYIEIKVWSGSDAAAPWIAKLEDALRPWIACRGDEDLADRLLSQLERSEEIAILDCATGGLLVERIGRRLREPRWEQVAPAVTLATEWCESSSPLEWVNGILESADEGSLTLALAGFAESGQWALGLRDGARTRAEVVQSPYSERQLQRPTLAGTMKSRKLLDRSRPFAAEMAIKLWSEWLSQSMN